MTFLTLFQQEQIKKVTDEIVAIIEEEGIDKFEERILLALRKHSKDYTITYMTREAMHKCDNMNR